MSNILKSTKLDIALVKPYFKTICFTLLLPIVFAAINRSLLTGVQCEDQAERDSGSGKREADRYGG